MDWSKIKMVFIITFLILDLFLVFQSIQKRNSNQLELMKVTTVEEQLEADKITYVELPKEPTKEAYITGKSKEFKEEEIRSLKHQTAILQDINTIVSTLKEPLVIPKSDKGQFFEEFLKTYVLDGTKYKYWKTDEKERKIYFFQKYEEKNIFYNRHAVLIVELNDTNEVTSYTQSMLIDVSEMGDQNQEQDIIASIKALETLYLRNEIKPGSRVTKVELGYYTIVIPSSGEQVIAPTWHFVVNGKEDYFVNAIEGQIIKAGEDNTQWSEIQ